MRRTFPALCAVLVGAAACAGTWAAIDLETLGEAAVTADGLHPVRSVWVGAVLVRSAPSLAGYDAVLLDPVSVSYKGGSVGELVTVHARSGLGSGPKTRSRLVRAFLEAFVAEIRDSQRFSLAQEPGPGVLRVSGHILDFIITAPPMQADEQHYISASGEMTLVLDVRDSQSDEALLRILDRRVIRPGSGGGVVGSLGAAPVSGGLYKNTPVNHWGAVREIFAFWARFARWGLEDLQALPLPEAAE